MERRIEIVIVGRSWEAGLRTENIEFTEIKKLTEEEIYRRDMRLANQDPERQKEIKFWDKIQDIDDVKLNKDDDEWDWD